LFLGPCTHRQQINDLYKVRKLPEKQRKGLQNAGRVSPHTQNLTDQESGVETQALMNKKKKDGTCQKL